jgi:DNA-directed RNA polymerase I subunit RPA49
MGTKLPGVPLPLLDGLLARFTETIGQKHVVTEKTKTKLLAWICVVWLHLEEYTADVSRLASELKMPPAKCVLSTM